MNMEKRLGKGGGMTIPSIIRRELGIQPGEKLKVQVHENGEIGLLRIEGRCIVCKESEQLKKVDKVFVCENCYKKMREVFENAR
ncbi:MAG: AbrB family transcriptional regulator [Peptostreptococcaceae bacterium]|nr:AbrB family transcriptional regulator [Peptostreptococcaceae bacterium]